MNAQTQPGSGQRPNGRASAGGVGSCPDRIGTGSRSSDGTRSSGGFPGRVPGPPRREGGMVSRSDRDGVTIQRRDALEWEVFLAGSLGRHAPERPARRAPEYPARRATPRNAPPATHRNAPPATHRSTPPATHRSAAPACAGARAGGGRARGESVAWIRPGRWPQARQGRLGWCRGIRTHVGGAGRFHQQAHMRPSH